VHALQKRLRLRRFKSDRGELWQDCSSSNAQNPIDTFPRNCPVDEEVANLLPNNSFNGIWETTRHNRQTDFIRANLLQTCYGLVVYVGDLLRTSYGETGVMDLGLKYRHQLTEADF